MAGNDAIVCIDKHRISKSESRDAVRNLPELVLGVNALVLLVGL